MNYLEYYLNLNNSTLFIKNIEKKENQQKQPEVKKDGKKLLFAGTAALATIGAATLLIVKGKINPSNIKKFGKKLADESQQQVSETVQIVGNEIKQKVEPKISDITFDKGIALKDGVKYTGVIEDTLKSGKKVVLEYEDGIIKKSVIDDLEKTFNYKSKQKIIDEAKRQQDKLKEILANSENISLSDFTKQVDGIKCKSAKQQELINKIIERKNAFIKKASTVYTKEDREKIIEYLSLKSADVERVMKASDLQIDIWKKYDSSEWYKKAFDIKKKFFDQILEIKDEEQLGRINFLLDKKSAIYDEVSFLQEASLLNEKKFARVCELADVGVYPSKAIHGEHIFKPIDLPEEQYHRFFDIKDKGIVIISESELKDILYLDEKKYKETIQFAEEYFCDTPLYFTSLPKENLEECIKAIKNGAAPDALFFEGLDTDKIKIINDLLADGYSYRDISSAKISQNGKIEYSQIKKIIDAKLSEENEKVKFSYEDLKNPEKYAEFKEMNRGRNIDGGLWLSEYIKGEDRYFGLSPECEDILLEKGCKERYKTYNKRPLARWIYRDDMFSFIKKFPEQGEIYSPKRMQSFAKTLDGAERSAGDNFSDTNLEKNIKFIVHPKEELSMAYDIGCGQFGGTEAIYKSSQQFKVLKKGWQTVQNPNGVKHRLYVIEMSEV